MAAGPDPSESSDSHELDDYRLVQRMVDGDAQALSVFYDRHAGLVYRICRRVLHDDQEAEQALIDIFHELWRRSGSFNPILASPRTYLVMLARHRAIDRLRRRRTERPDEMVETASSSQSLAGQQNESDDPADLVLRSEEAWQINQALGQLPERQCEMIELSFYEGLSHRQIAEQLDTPLGTVKTSIRRGLVRLREQVVLLYASMNPPSQPANPSQSTNKESENPDGS